MFTHIVFFKLNDPSKENLERAKNILEQMEGKIPQLKYIEVGVDVLHTERSYDIALTTRFDSLEDMQEYQVHPYHVNEVLKNLRPMLKASSAVDY
ncbi:Dabb family protein [Clostridium thermarum]|uniref:Dabb family protein n=1 Tax=Clostridium thermarum TaxID=1716543 RepID=UPI0013D2C0D4|nr:Dabb family protein [Clostridium thermarum]